MIELQAKWVAHVLSGKTNLPSQQQMLDDTEQHYRRLEANGTPKHQSHSLRGIMVIFIEFRFDLFIKFTLKKLNLYFSHYTSNILFIFYISNNFRILYCDNKC